MPDEVLLITQDELVHRAVAAVCARLGVVLPHRPCAGSVDRAQWAGRV